MSLIDKIQKKYEVSAWTSEHIFVVVGDRDVDCAYTKKSDAEKHIKHYPERKHQRIITIDLYNKFVEG